MTTLRTKTRTIRAVDYVDLERFVKEITGKDWSFPAVEECGNDSDHSFAITKTPLSDYDRDTMAAWLSGDDLSGEPGRRDGPWAQLVLDWLCIQGHIEPGEYLVQVSW